MKTRKEFDAVKMMRDIRNKHQQEYEKNPELREKKLVEIRRKFASLIKIKENAMG
jgi:hypothetical protein